MAGAANYDYLLTLAQLDADSDAVWVAVDTPPLFFTFHRAIPE